MDETTTKIFETIERLSEAEVNVMMGKMELEKVKGR